MKVLCACLALLFAASVAVNFITVNEANKRIEAANASVLRVNQELAKAQKYVEKGAVVPVQVRTRPALLGGGGQVIVFANESTKPLVLDVQIESATSALGKAYRLELPAAVESLKEIGHLEGWPAAKGDHVKISCEGYEPTTFTLP